MAPNLDVVVGSTLVPPRCRNCGWELSPSDLFCAYCGIEAPETADRPTPTPVTSRLYRAECQGCGASMRFDASQQALACPFCGASRLVEAMAGPAPTSPTQIVPYAITREQAEAAFKTFATSSFWYPGDLAASARFEQFRQVYVPAWRFTGQVHTYWTADTSEGADHTWRPVAGERRSTVESDLVLASRALTAQELADLAPFALTDATLFDEQNLDSAAVIETPVLTQHGALEQLPATARAREEAAVATEVGGNTRNVHCDQLITEVVADLALLPVWIVAYRYHDTAYRFLVNGRTGEVHGSAPTSVTKQLAVVVVILAVVLIVVLWLMASQ